MPTLPHFTTTFFLAAGLLMIMDAMNLCRRTFWYRYLCLIFVNLIPTGLFFLAEMWNLSGIHTWIINITASLLSLILFFIYFTLCYDGKFSKKLFTWFITDFYLSITAILSSLAVISILQYESYHIHSWTGFWLFLLFFAPLTTFSYLFLRRYLKKLLPVTQPPFFISHVLLPFYVLMKFFVNINPYFPSVPYLYLTLMLSSSAVVMVFAVISHIQKQKLIYTANYLEQQRISNKRYEEKLNEHFLELTKMKKQMESQLEYLNRLPKTKPHDAIHEYADSLRQMIQELNDQIHSI